MASDLIDSRMQGFVQVLKLDDQASVARASLATSSEARKALDANIASLSTLGDTVRETVFAHFCAQYLPALVQAYKATPDNILVSPYTSMIHYLLDKGHFARYLRTKDGSGLLEIQARRFAGEALPREVKQIWNVVQIFNFLIVYSYHDRGRVDPVINPDYVNTIREKCEAYRHLCYNSITGYNNQRVDPLAQSTFVALTETEEFLDGERSSGQMLGAMGMMMPLATCGDELSGCWRTGIVPSLACARCQSVNYCGAEHQRSHWPKHKIVCIKPIWL